MSDLISRQAVIDRINKQREHLHPDTDTRDFIGNCAYNICIEFIERLPSAEPNNECEKCVFSPFKQFRQTAQSEQRWIPCSERLPDKGLRVLMQLNNAWQIVGWYDKEDKQWYALPFSQEVVNDRVLAWMPLPEDYEEDK